MARQGLQGRRPKRRRAAWIDHRYNRRRRHFGIGMLSPVEYEQANEA